jgi:uncharacterized coiled-coil DUF342 family protein
MSSCRTRVICLSAIGVIFIVLGAVPTQIRALPDNVETFDSEIATMPVSVFANGSVVFVVAGDGVSFGGQTIANVTDELPGDYILVDLYDNGMGPGDFPDDGAYTGNFTVVDDLGVNGQFTDNTTDTIDLMDGGMATIIVDIDTQMDPGTAEIQADFSPPTVAINSVSEIVHVSYTLNATITDPNMDTSNVWYNVDGGTNHRLMWRGGDDYESIVDTTSLSESPHIIRVVAFDAVQNSDSTQTVSITVDHPAPDIGVSVTYEPSEPKEGDTVVITVDIENTGDADADNVAVSLIVDGTEVDQQIETIPTGDSRTVQFEWTATEGPHNVSIEVRDGGVSLASSPLELFDIQPGQQDLLENPLFLVAIITIIAIVMVGGTVAWAYLGKELVIGSKPGATPVEAAPTIPPGEHDPCADIRRKWKAIQGEYERAKAEMESAQRRADDLRNETDRAKQEEERANKKAEEADKEYADARKDLEDLKQKMHDFFDEGVTGEGISVGYPQEGQQNQRGFFRDAVKIFFSSPEQERAITRFLDENSEPFKELEKDHEETERNLMDLKNEAASDHRKAMEARARAEEAESRARQAKQEYDALRHEVQSLGDRADAFRQKWRICMLKRLDEAADRAESASLQASEAARRAKKAQGRGEFEKTKEDAQTAREKGGQAKEDSKWIKEKLEDEGFEEDTSEHDDRMERAERDALSGAKDVFALGAKFFQDQM